MCKLTLTAGLCLTIISLASATKLVCYFDSLAENRPGNGSFTVSNIDAFKCTHLIYAFADINGDHELVPTRFADLQNYLDFNALKRNKNPLLKTLLSVGGPYFDAEKFRAMVSTAEYRSTFIWSAISLLRQREFDGLSLDWLFPGEGDRESFTTLVEELEEAFRNESSRTGYRKLLLAASVSAEKEVIDASYEVEAIAMKLDFISVVTLNFSGPDNVARHHSPLYSGNGDTGDLLYSNTDFAMQYWLDQGAPSEKLLLFIALFGKVFTLSSSNTSVGAPIRGTGDPGCYTNQPGYWAFYEICLYVPENSTFLIPDQHVPYGNADTQWVGFDNVDSIDAKVDYLKANHLGGAAVYSLDLDDFNGKFCGLGKCPLVRHLSHVVIPGPNEYFCVGKHDGLYSVEFDIRAFYHCAHGRTYVKYCQQNLVFNERKKRCDYPSEVHLTYDPTTPYYPPTTETTIPPPVCDQDFCYWRPDGYYAVHSDPSAYYQCAFKQTYCFRCPSVGLVMYDVLNHNTYYYLICDLSLLTEGLCLAIISLASATKLVCYFDSLAENRPGNGSFTVSNIDAFKCTHLIYAFADINGDHELVPTRFADLQNYLDFNALKRKNPQLKTLLAVGGPDIDTNKFSEMVSTQQTRNIFIQSAITLLRQNQFHGLNLDWRYPGAAGSDPQDKQRFSALCWELKIAFEAEGSRTYSDRLIITASVSAKREIISAGYEVAKIARNLDFINVLTYDFHDSSQSAAQHHSPLFNGSQDSDDTASAIQNWLDQGAPSEKLNMGLALYGRVFTLITSSQNVGAPIRGTGDEGCYTKEPGFWASYEICMYVEENTVQLIPDQKVSYATVDHQWVGFENKNSLNAKVSYLKTKNLGGAVVWSLDLDDFSGQFCKTGKYPLISHLHNLILPDTSPGTHGHYTNGNDNFCQGKYHGLYSVPDNPTAFYNCAYDVTYIQYCPHNLVFHEDCQCCNYSPTHGHDGTGNDNFCQGKHHGLYNVPGYPTAFYNCGHGITHIGFCSNDLIFNKDCQCCDYSSTYHIPTHTTPSTHGHYGTGNDNFCQGKYPRRYSVPHVPSAFYNCAHDVTYIQYCPYNLVFYEDCQCCNYSSTHSFPPHTTTSPHGHDNFCQGKHHGLYNVPGYPKAFYNCGHGITHIGYCQNDLIFNKDCQCCDYSQTYHIPAQTTTSTHGHYGTGNDNFCKGKHPRRYSVPHVPTAFYNCAHDVTYIQHCPYNLVFYEDCQCCNYSSTHSFPTHTTTSTHGHYGVGNQNFCQGKYHGLYSVPGYPTAFYNCAYDVTYIQYCPHNLVFHEDCQCCNYSPTHGHDGTGNDNFCQGKHHGLYNVPGYPTAFYNCGHGITHIGFCSNDLIFNKDCQCCDYSSTYHIPTHTTPSTHGHYGTGNDNFCQGKYPRRYSVPHVPSAFYNCAHDVTYIQYCPYNLVFYEDCQCCNYSSTHSFPPHTTTSPHGHDNFCQGKHHGLYNVPGYPKAFYNCGHGITHIGYCQNDLIFNKDCQCCDYSQTYHIPAQTTTSTHGHYGTGNDNFCKGKHPRRYSVPHVPTAFYNCAHDVTYIQHCPYNLVFYEDCQCCNYSSTHSFPTHTTTSTHGHYGVGNHNFCQGKHHGLYNVPGYPTAFYNCGHGITHIDFCPNDLIFNKDCQCCDYSSTHHIPTHTTTSTHGHYGTGNDNFCEGKHPRRYSVPHFPKAFYNCAFGVTYVQNCPGDLVFSESCHCCTDSSHGYIPTDTTTTTNGHYVTSHDSNFCHGKYDGRYSVPGVPTSYYECDHGVTYIQYCPYDWIYQESCHCCDTIPTTSPTTSHQHYTTTTKVTTDNFCEGHYDGLYSVPNYPSSYYSCAHGVTHILYCPADLVFSESCHCCTHSSHGYIPTDTTPTTNGHYATSHDSNFCHGKYDGLYSVPDALTSYYECDHGVTYIRHCPHDWVYQESCHCCDYPPTETTPTTSPTTSHQHYTTTTKVTTDNFCEGHYDGLYSVPNYPSSYYSCAHGVTHILYCPADLVFSESCHCCTHSSHGYIPTDTTPTTNGHYATSHDSNFCHGKYDGLYSVPDALTSYYECDHGVTYIRHCPHDWVYQESCHCCDYPPTETTPTTSPTTSHQHYTTTTKVTTDNFCEGHYDGLYSVPNYPSSYYSCAHGVTHILYCPADLVFSESCHCCTHSSHGYIPTDTTPTTNGHYATSHDSNFCHGKYDGLYSVPDALTSYYECDHGVTYIRHCPHDWVYQESCHCCDYPPTETTPTTSPTTSHQHYTTTTKVTTDNFCEGHYDGLYSVPNYPSSYYSCAHGVTHILYCPADLVFSESCHCCTHSSHGYIPTDTTPTTNGHYATSHDSNFCHGKYDGLYSVPDALTSYYECDHGVTYIRHCPHDWVYQESCHCCDYPPTETTPTTSPTTSHQHYTTTTKVTTDNFCEGHYDGLYSVPNYPSSYYSCAHGVTHILYCPADLVFSESCHCCTHSSHGYIPTDTTPTTNGHYATSHDSNFCHGKYDGLYSVPDALTSYYECDHGVTYIRHCPHDWVYQESCHCCDYPPTETTPTTSPTTSHQHYTTTTKVTTDNFCEGHYDGLYSVPNYPSSYYSCAHGVTHILYCPADLVFSESCHCCTHSSHGYIPTDTTPTTNGHYATSHDSNFCHGKYDGLYSVPDALTSYYECDHGVTYIRHCPHDWVYQESCHCCDYPPTETTPTTSPTTSHQHYTTTTKVTTDNFCEGHYDGLYSVPNYPSSYYSCAHGVTHILYCPADLVFSESCHCCTHSSHGYIPTDTTPTTNGHYATSHDSNFCHGKYDGLYSVPDALTSYYECDHGVTYIRHCPHNWVYQESCHCCDYPPTETTPTTSPTTSHQHYTTTTKVTTDNFCEGHYDGLYSVPNYPSSYYSCAHGVTHILYCPADLVFSESCHCCTHSSHGYIPTDTTPTTNGNYATSHDSNFCHGKYDGLYSVPDALTSYYECDHGVTYIRHCPHDWVYQESCHCCDSPPTETTPTTSPTTSHQHYTTTTEVTTDNFCEGHYDGLYSVPNYPSSYYSCVHGVTHILYCPADLVFSESCHCCTHSSHGYIPTDTTPTTNGHYATSHDSNFCHGKYDGLYSVPDALTSYYECDHGVTYIRHCPHDWVYQESCHCCDSPQQKLLQQLLPQQAINITLPQLKSQLTTSVRAIMMGFTVFQITQVLITAVYMV
ncbi:uncharacterized protein V6R79_002568 [Siganus canaliculatus]